MPSGWSSLPITPSNLTLANTLPVGQSFLWHRHTLPDAGEEYSRAVGSDGLPRVVCLRQSPTSIYYTAIHPTPEATAADHAEGLTRAWLEDYFNFTRYPSLEQLYNDWRTRDPAFFAKVELDKMAIGVRVLRQDPWETLVAFITSTNNHIPRITSLLHRLSERFSSPLLTLDNPDGAGETVYRLFPRPSDLPEAGLESILREIGFGYRASFLDVTLASLRSKGSVEDELERWRSLPLEETQELLIGLKGVGRKVADCVMLMCMDQPSLIPIDTHIYSIAAQHPAFPSRLRNKTMSKAIYDDIQSFLSEKWGPLGGWCQAVVFAADLKPKASPKIDAKRNKTVTAVKAKRSPSPDDDVPLRNARRSKRTRRTPSSGKEGVKKEEEV